MPTLRNNTTFLENSTAYLNDVLSRPDPEAHKIVIVQICEKNITHSFGHCRNVTYAYEQIKNGFAGHEVLVSPEFEGNHNWTKTREWLATNFSGVPIVVDVFEGGFYKLPHPNVMMNITELKQVMAVANVTAIRFPELISWLMNQTSPNVFIPTAWVHDIFDFAISNNLRIIWSEWKLGNNVEALTNSILAGYEEKITYVSQTNNEFQHPVIGFLYAMQFPNWGASLQSWYWETNGFGNNNGMPISEFVQHTLIARNLGAQIIMFEPYWYFFDNGEPRDIVNAIWLAT